MLNWLTGRGFVLDGLTGRSLVLDWLAGRRFVLDGLTGRGLVLDGLTGRDLVPDGLTGRDLVLDGLTGRDLVLDGLTGRDLVLHRATGGGLVLDGLTGKSVILYRLTGGDITLRLFVGRLLCHWFAEGLLLVGLTVWGDIGDGPAGGSVLESGRGDELLLGRGGGVWGLELDALRAEVADGHILLYVLLVLSDHGGLGGGLLYWGLGPRGDRSLPHRQVLLGLGLRLYLGLEVVAGGELGLRRRGDLLLHRLGPGGRLLVGGALLYSRPAAGPATGPV